MDIYIENKIKDLLFRIYKGKFFYTSDIDFAVWLQNRNEDLPTWIHVIAGGNPENLEEVLKTAREELGHELLNTDKVKV